MAMRGVQRATMDLDFLLLLDDLEQADAILRSCGYVRGFHSDNVSHYRMQGSGLGRIDILHAFRSPSLGMLERSERLQILPEHSVPVLQIEDLVGLKIQAAVNDPEREVQDWLDIEMLLRAPGNRDTFIDWELIADYLEIFDLDARLEELKRWHGETDRH